MKNNSKLTVKSLLDVGNSGTGKIAIKNSVIDITGASNSGDSLRIGCDGPGEIALFGGKSKIIVKKRLTMSVGRYAASKLILNGGSVIVGGELVFGKIGPERAKSEIVINSGLLQADSISFNMKNAKITFKSGKLLVNSSNLSEAAMKQLIEEGRIDVSNSANWRISTVNGFTVLSEGAE
jgi:hypothetical protein